MPNSKKKLCTVETPTEIREWEASAFSLSNPENGCLHVKGFDKDGHNIHFAMFGPNGWLSAEITDAE